MGRLAEGLDGNTVLEAVDLGYNDKLTDVERLLAAVGRSGVVRVDLDGTGVSEEKVTQGGSIAMNPNEGGCPLHYQRGDRGGQNRYWLER